MKTPRYRRKKFNKRILEKAQAGILDLAPEQMERLERHRAYLEVYWNTAVSAAEAFVDVIRLKSDRRSIRN